MFVHSPVTDRVARLRKLHRDSVPTLDADRTRIITEYYQKIAVCKTKLMRFLYQFFEIGVLIAGKIYIIKIFGYHWCVSTL